MTTIRNIGLSLITSLAAGALLVGCGDDDVTPPVDAGGTPDSGPGPDTGPEPDGGPIDAGTPTDCDRYCDAITTNCTGDNAQHDDRAQCVAYCEGAGWPLGTVGEMAGNTLECRIYHAGVAAGDPVLHCPHAGPTGATVCGTVDFRSDDPGTYTRVDRMGMPAVSTALIMSANKNAYNDADPADDEAGDFVLTDLVPSNTALHTALDDDLTDAGLTPCSMVTLVDGLPECFGQNVAVGVRVYDLVIPDTLRIDPAGEPGFPNGRTLPDPVIDVTLSVILLRLGSGTCGAAMCSPTTLVGGTNPTMNDVGGGDFLDDFPYLHPPHTP